MELVPLGVVTVTSTVPVPAGETAVIDVGDVTAKAAAADPKLTLVVALSSVPVIVTVVPPSSGPALGLTSVTVGTGGSVVNS